VTAVHHHDDLENEAPKAGHSARVLLAALLIPLVVLTAVATVLLWPSEIRRSPTALGPPTELVDATITRIDSALCQNGNLAAGSCITLYADVTSGPDDGQEVVLTLPEGPGQPSLHDRDKIVLGRSADPVGQVAYYFSDFQRRSGLAAIAAVFAVFVVLVARWRGLGALIGLGITYAVVTQFMLPAILDGRSPVAVSLSGGAIIVLLVLYVAHGLNARTTTAVVGTLMSLCLVGALAVLAVDITNITGLSSEEATYVQSFAGTVNIKGLLLGGMVLGALGVLNDMTVTQASAVWEIHRASPGRSRRALYRSGMRVGRDHIASTVYTLVLAYTGAALPLLILFTLADRAFLDVVTTDVVGEEIVRTLVGSIGLIASVPITTALAAIVVGTQRSRVEDPVPESLPLDEQPMEPIRPSEVTPRDEKSAREDLEDVPAPIESEPGNPTLEGANADGQNAEVANHVDEGPPEPVREPVLPPLVGPKKRRRFSLRRNRSGVLGARNMTRRERKFWEED